MEEKYEQPMILPHIDGIDFNKYYSLNGEMPFKIRDTWRSIDTGDHYFWVEYIDGNTENICINDTSLLKESSEDELMSWLI